MKSKLFLLNLLLFLLFTNSTTTALTTTSSFGWRDHPVTGKHKFHAGVDIRAKHGTPIRAIFAGKVIWAGVRGGYGNVILLWHGKKTYTLYGHCACLFVKPGQYVEAGETIALVGSTGLSTGPHLHLEYWVDGRYVDPMTLWRKQQK